MPTPTRYLALLFTLAALTRTASSAAPAAPQIDACKLTDKATVAATLGVALTSMDSTPGARGGTCDFTTEPPKHLDITIFYAPIANPGMYGFNQPTPPNNIAIPNLGDAALFANITTPADRYSSENFTVLKGKSILNILVTADKSLPLIPKEKLAALALKMLAKM
jgi:hypothetical protein